MKLSEIKRRPPKILMFGPYGTGKTAFTETLGEWLKILDIDDGSIVGMGFKDKWITDRQKVDVEVFTDTDPLEKAIAYPALKRRLSEIVRLCQTNRFPFKALCLDSLTRLSEAALRYVFLQQNRLYDPDKRPRIQDWGLVIEEIEQIILMLNSLPIVTVLIAHDEIEVVEHEDGKTKEIITQISIPGKKLQPRIPQMFDEIYHTQVLDLGAGKKQYSIISTPTNRVKARSRCSIPNPFDMSLGMKTLLKHLNFDYDMFSPPFTPPVNSETVKT